MRSLNPFSVVLTSPSFSVLDYYYEHGNDHHPHHPNHNTNSDYQKKPTELKDKKPKILILHEKLELMNSLNSMYTNLGFAVDNVLDPEWALQILVTEPVKLIVLNCEKSSDTFNDFIRKAHKMLPPDRNHIVPVVTCTKKGKHIETASIIPF